MIGEADVGRRERAAIRAFVAEHASALSGRVLDYGCGLQPYRDLVAGDYECWDDPAHPNAQSRTDFGPNPLERGEAFDAILCTQVVQLVDDPAGLLEVFAGALRPGGRLVVTVSQGYREVLPEDRWRWTGSGLAWLLGRAGLAVVASRPTWEVEVAPGFLVAMGHGALARA